MSTSPSLSATARATELLPLPAGPSMATKSPPIRGPSIADRGALSRGSRRGRERPGSPAGSRLARLRLSGEPAAVIVPPNQIRGEAQGLQEGPARNRKPSLEGRRPFSCGAFAPTAGTETPCALGKG